MSAGLDPAASDHQQMRKVDLEKDKGLLTQAQREYMRIAQERNAERVNRLRRLRRGNLFTGFALGISVVSIFGYSIWSVGSEKFLDDFNAPPDRTA